MISQYLSNTHQLEDVQWKPMLRDLFRKKPEAEGEQPPAPKEPSRSKQNSRRRHSMPKLQHETAIKNAASPRKQQHLVDDIGMPPRCASIPSSIHLMAAVPSDGDGYDGDDGDDSTSQSPSVVSEVTMMTYSDEKAKLLKAEFLQRIKQQTKRLTLQERESLLLEIQQKQKWTFKPEDQVQDDIAVIVGKGEPVVTRAQRRSSMPTRSFCSSYTSMQSEVMDEVMEPEKKEQATPNFKYYSPYSNSRGRDEAASSHQDNQADQQVQHHQPRQREVGLGLTRYRVSNSNFVEEPCDEILIEELADVSLDDDASQDVASKAISNKACIDDIIELKLLVANQQAMIDTLSSKLHNSELANRQLMAREQGRREELENENQRLATQLDDSNREEKMHEVQAAQLETRNRRLQRENLNLQRQLQDFKKGNGSSRRGSLITHATAESTDADSFTNTL